ncbi:hypothetical protein JX266_001168 [Neoarthrinium moseri]|nr:hypothetical protein JX266_001168 [Neoarthrinium moseri]
MSLSQANTSLARTKPLRNPIKSSLTATQPSSATGNAIPSTASHVSLFLTNLRLLDLDQEPDWPEITSATFSARDAAGGQKKRIQCVEWALYNLFLLWDEAEGRNKLKPFYPPLDQVQSVNLRAALLRGLEQAKRNGVLGRDAVIRKTMLDECKGERFEEVLAVFSSAVLKKLVAERALNSGFEYRPTISEKISLENWGYSGERTELNGLLLAHKASLGSTLADKNAARERYRDFADLLALKQRGLARRREQAKAAKEQAGATAVPEHTKKQTRQILRANWTGNEQWIDTILYDEMTSRQGGLLASNFDHVWSGVREGRLSDLEDKTSGLLEQLDQRVRLQRSRLEKWQGFRRKLFGDEASAPMPPTSQPRDQIQGVDLGFTAHRQLQPELGIEGGTVLKPPHPPPEYEQLLESMRIELQSTERPRVLDLSKLRRTRAAEYDHLSLAPPSTAVEQISDLSEWEDEQEEEQDPAPKTASVPSNKAVKGSSSQLTRDRALRRPVIRQTTSAESSTSVEGSSSLRKGRHQRSESKKLQMNLKSEPGPVVRQESPMPHIKTPDMASSPELEAALQSDKELEVGSTQPEPRPISPTQAMADQILASMSNASPSPIKKSRHTLSLAERTRMSMTRTKSFDPEDDLDLNLLSPSTAKSLKAGSISAPANVEPSSGEAYEDLIARTRRSMAGFEAAKQKAQLDRRRSERKSKMPQKKDSYFPKLAEEDETVDASIIDELLEAPQEDMEAVFKSRPRMRTSPVPSPGGRWDEEGYES